MLWGNLSPWRLFCFKNPKNPLIMQNSFHAQSSWIIKTKLCPPNLPARQIIRRHLLEDSAADRCSRLTIVHAPAGYGKTTFLKQWYEYHLKNNSTAGWLSLDEEERDPSLFISYLSAALKRAGVPCVSLETLVGQGVEYLPASSIAAIIINTLEQFKERLTLFLDDYQLVSVGAINELVQKTVARLPDNVSVVLSSRVYPDFAVQNLRNQGKVREISIPDLRFNQEEMGSVLEFEFGIVELLRLLDRTEGWPIACHMINVLLRSKLFNVNHIDTFSGRTTDLALYITEQVFASLADREQEFLMNTSISNRFTGDLANELCKGLDCWIILETLVKQDMFLVPLDTESKWYRYHQLFREYLYERLRRNFPEQISRLHLIAAKWFCRNGHIPEAVEHALKGQDQRLAARIVDNSGGWRLIYEDKYDWVMNIFKRLGETAIVEFPRLFMADLILLVKRGMPQDALQRINDMHEETNGFEHWAGKPLDHKVRIELELVRRLILGDYTDQPVSVATLSYARDCLKSISGDDCILRCLLHDALSSAYLDAGLLDKADNHINLATSIYERSGFFYGAVYICFHRAKLHMERARLHDAREDLLKAEDITSRHLDANFNIVANTSIFLADVAFMQNRTDEARQLLGTAMDYIEKHDSWFDLYGRAYTTAAALALTTHGLETAGSVLDRARSVAAERNLPRLKQLSDLMEIKLLLQAARTARAAELADRINLAQHAARGTSPKNLSVYIPERATLVLARLYLMQHKPDKVLKLLSPLAHTLRTQKRLRLLVEVSLLLARASYCLNDYKNTHTFLTGAIEIALHGEYTRPFFDEGKAIIEIHDRLHYGGFAKRQNRFYRSFLADINRAMEKQAQAVRQLLDKHDLTHKEYKVIKEMAKGHTNKEIASSLYITEDTVKYRLKQLFRKWQVTSRKAAVRMARDKSLV